METRQPLTLETALTVCDPDPPPASLCLREIPDTREPHILATRFPRRSRTNVWCSGWSSTLPVPTMQHHMPCAVGSPCWPPWTTIPQRTHFYRRGDRRTPLPDGQTRTADQTKGTVGRVAIGKRDMLGRPGDGTQGLAQEGGTLSVKISGRASRMSCM